jgi:hypothetical protein
MILTQQIDESVLLPNKPRISTGGKHDETADVFAARWGLRGTVAHFAIAFVA